MSDFNNRIVAVINKSLAPGKAMNTLAHISLSLGAINNEQDFSLISFNDKEQNSYPNISKMPYVILKANSNKIKNLKKLALENNIQQITFTDTMTIGNWEAQLELTKGKTEEELIFYGIVLFGDKNFITELTKKFSLWN